MSTNKMFALFYGLICALGVYALMARFNLMPRETFMSELVVYLMAFGCVVSFVATLHALALFLESDTAEGG